MKVREHWGSRLGFVLAAVGSAVGLGNIWKFPFITGMYGGAAFVLFYLISILLIGLPVMLIEFSIGRKTQLNPVGAFQKLAPSSPYFLIGAMGVLCGFIILSYYSVVAGWTLTYMYKAVAFGFKDFSSPEIAGEAFTAYSSSPIWPVLSHAVFMFLCIFVVSKGVKVGIERWNRILMPTLFVIILLLIVRGLTLEGADAGLKFLFVPDFSKLTANAMLVAMGHAFFTLSLGMGAMLTYGSYLSEKEDLVKSSLWIIVADTGVALLAGIAIFTAVFAMGFEPAGGPGLVFHVLPAIFSMMPGGNIMGFLFFALLSIAALTSGMSLLEVVTAYFIDQKGWSRRKASIAFGFLIFLVGVPSALSFGALKEIIIFKMNLFDFFDYLSFKYMLPLGGFFMVLFTIFRWKPKSLLEELKRGGPGLKISVGLATVLLLISAVFVGVTFVAGVLGVG
ncbi:MAG: sodium-dependent transporter [Candidatus Hatepunaea meridiana]|nr:sodium-dependent transporter [Candidatus Hatepunaea meridiana]